MPIKFSDTFEPSGDFKLLDGKHLTENSNITASSVSASGDISASNFHGTVAAGNISGRVASASNALTASFVTASNVSGRVASASNALTASLAVLVKDANAITFTVNNAAQADNADSLGNTAADNWDLAKVTGNGATTTAQITASTFSGSGVGLHSIPATGVVGLNLDKIENGIYSASIISSSTAASSSLTMNLGISSSGTIDASNFKKGGIELVTSASLSSSVSTINASIATLQADVDQNESDADQAIANLSQSFSSSLVTIQSDIDQNESDADQAILNLSQSFSSSLVTIQADINQNESDADQAILNLSQSFSGSVVSLQTDINTRAVSSSVSSSIAAINVSIANLQSDVDQNETDADDADASLQTQIDNRAVLSGSDNNFTGAITSSGLLVQGSAVITGSMTFNGIAFTETVIASSTGSHVFGSGSDANTHTFTGSILTNGDVNATGTGSFGALEVSGNSLDMTGVTKNHILKFNGTRFVAVPEGTTFTFSIKSFTISGEGETKQLIGSGSAWKPAGAITFSAEYNNPPPLTASVNTVNDGGGVPNFDMGSGTNFEGPITNSVAIEYPTNVGTQLYWILSANDGEDSDSKTIANSGKVRFRNYYKWGVTGSNTVKTAASIDGLQNSETDYFDGTITKTLNPGASEYIAFAHREDDADIHQVRCGDGIHILTVAMNPSDPTSLISKTQVSNYSNTLGYVENFSYYVSSGSNLDSHSSTFETLTSNDVKNYIYWGTSESWTSNESNVTSLTNKNSTQDDGDIVGATFAMGTFHSEFAILAIPSRYGTNENEYTLKDQASNLPWSVEDPVDVVITNPVGFRETYKVYRSSFQLGTPASPSSLVVVVT